MIELTMSSQQVSFNLSEGYEGDPTPVEEINKAIAYLEHQRRYYEVLETVRGSTAVVLNEESRKTGLAAAKAYLEANGCGPEDFPIRSPEDIDNAGTR